MGKVTFKGLLTQEDIDRYSQRTKDRYWWKPIGRSSLTLRYWMEDSIWVHPSQWSETRH